MNFPEIEQKILRFWEEKKIFDKLRQKNKGKKRWSFLDGPITANNPMGVHHAWGRTYKDVFQRYKAMQGLDGRYQNGFDCQGLWVEVEVEKELGFRNKKDIERYGIERFVQKCKERVLKYSKIQTEQSIRLGQWMDWDNSYYTMSDENNYAIWHFLKKCKEKGLLYKGRDSVPWCPRCGTSISQHEILTEEYKELVHKSIFFKLPVVGQEKTYFLVWTTTPWTLPGNVALAVHPDFDYAKVKDKEGSIFLVLKEKANLVENGEVIETMKGKKLDGLQYEGLFDEMPAVQKALGSYKHRVILWKEVTAEEGTGIVHIAPGCGQEDFQLAKDLGLPVIDLSTGESAYRKGFGQLTGKLVNTDEVRDWIFEALEHKGKVFRIEDYKHRYPTCWRCKSELIFRVVDEWYISMDKLRKPLMESAKKIHWMPGFCLEREIDWLENMRDWLISKKRYWGLALPIFECECGHFEVFGSKEELKKKAVEGWDKFEGHSPHRPWIDVVKIKCPKCRRVISRIRDVGTPWLDAGIVPFSTIAEENKCSVNVPEFRGQMSSYFRDKKYWKKWFPVDFVCESFPGQFKNWFYVLLVMSQVLENKPSFRTLLGYAMVVDEKGEEMHKSKGNAIWFDEAVEKIGADVMRWMYVKQNPVFNMRFGYNIAGETKRKLLTLWNCYTFFETYGQKPTSGVQESVGSEDILDKWILSRLHTVIKESTEGLDRFDAAKASQAIEDFFINDLSLWYIRRSRKRFQMDEKEQASRVLYFVLLTLAKLIAPLMPFFAEEMYQKLRLEEMLESVHLGGWPSFAKASDGKPTIDEKLEKQMERVRKIVSLVLAKRMELGIKVRQPLAVLRVNPAQKIDKELVGLIKEEVNVRDVLFDEKIDGVELDTKITPELKEEGYIREIIRHIQALRKKAGLVPKDKVVVYYSTTEELERVLLKNRGAILETTKSKGLEKNLQKQGGVLAEKEVKINGAALWLAIGDKE